MSYHPSSRGFVPSVFLSTFSRESILDPFNNLRATAPSSATWSAANRAFYVPFWLDRGITVYRFWWLNGATVGTNNLQAGLYDNAGTSIILGTSTLSAGANACQFDDITDISLGPGQYFMALWCNGTTATVFRQGSSTFLPYLGMFMQSSLTSGLPATATMVTMSVNFLPVFGLSLRSTP